MLQALQIETWPANARWLLWCDVESTCSPQLVVFHKKEGVVGCTRFSGYIDSRVVEENTYLGVSNRWKVEDNLLLAHHIPLMVGQGQDPRTHAKVGQGQALRTPSGAAQDLHTPSKVARVLHTPLKVVHIQSGECSEPADIR